MLNVFQSFCKDNGLKVNVGKTKCMYFNCIARHNHIDGGTIKEVQAFNYLGIVFRRGPKSTLCMVGDRVDRTTQAFNMLKQHCRFTGMKVTHTRLLLMQALCVSHSLFGCVIWGHLMGPDITLHVATNTQQGRLDKCYKDQLRWAM